MGRLSLCFIKLGFEMRFSPVGVSDFNSLTDGELHLWLVDFAALAPEFERYQQFLTSDQLVRMRRFTREESQRQLYFHMWPCRVFYRAIWPIRGKKCVS